MTDEFGINDVVKTAEVIHKVLPETTKEADGVLSTMVGLFNNVVLYPLKKANLTYEYKLEDFKRELEEKTKYVPQECLRYPRKNIAGPILEGLRYSADEIEIRNIFVNLLAADMDTRNGNIVHPSYIGIVLQMDSFDARLFKYLASSNGYIRAVNPNIGIVGTNKVFVQALPEWYIFSPFNDTMNPFLISSALIRLANFGLIDLMYDRTAGSDKYPDPLENKFITDIFNRYQEKNNGQLEMKNTDSIINVNDFGRCFAKICFKE